MYKNIILMTLYYRYKQFIYLLTMSFFNVWILKQPVANIPTFMYFFSYFFDYFENRLFESDDRHIVNIFHVDF